MRNRIRFSGLVGLIYAASCQSGLSQVAIDVGHYKDRPGAISARGVPEFEFNASLAMIISDVLTQNGLRNSLIGNSGVPISLEQRTQRAREQESRFFLSIHHDSVQPQYLSSWLLGGKEHLYSDQFSGYSLFVSRSNPRYAESLACATELGLALKREGFNPTSHHAEPIEGERREWANQEAGVYINDKLVVLKTSDVPAVLLEAGVIVNRAEELQLRTPSIQKKIASAISAGLSRCSYAWTRTGEHEKP